MSDSLTSAEVAVMFNVNQRTPWAWWRAGKLQAELRGGILFFGAAQLIGWKPPDGRGEACRKRARANRKAKRARKK